ncbi:MAG: hypothetical protein HQL74_05860 [Magnetococcales bacterium]|nr:hypothetical protein [Magnetococcales bacterium]
MMAVIPALVGASTYMATGSVWMALGKIGLMALGQFLTPNGQQGSVSSASGNTVPPVDPGLGFAPMPQYPSPELPVPIVFGKSRLNGLVIHTRIYGGNYEKGHYLVVFGEVGLTLDQLYIDKYKIEDLPNYYTKSGGVQNSESSWYTFHPLGGQAQISLDNSGTWEIGIYRNTIGNIAAPVPAMFYGGGTLTCWSYHSFTNEGNMQWYRWKITNISDPNQVYYSPTYWEWFFEEVEISGNYAKVPGSKLRSHQFNVSVPLSRWAVELEVTVLLKGAEGEGTKEGSQIGIYKFDLTDMPFTEGIPVNATYAHVHLVKDASLASNNPVISALVHSTGTSGMGGNPADAMLIFLTDPVVGLGLPGESIDSASQITTSYWCEQKGYGFNRAYAAFYDAEQVFREICTAGRIMTLSRDGKIFLKPDDVEPASYKVGETETIPGSIRVGIQATNRPNRIEAQYVEPYFGYTMERIYAEDLDAIARDGLQTQTIDLTGVTDQAQAYALAVFMLRTIQECPYWCSFKVGMATARLLPLGGVVEVESTTNALIGSKQWRVVAIEETEAFIYQIECIQYSADVYTEPTFTPWYNDTVDLEPVQGWPDPYGGALMVVNFRVTGISYPSGGGALVTVDWNTPPQSPRYDYCKIQWLHPGGEWVDQGTSVNGPFSFVWPYRYGMMSIRAVSCVTLPGFLLTNVDTAPAIEMYVSGNETDDFPGYGGGMYGQQYYGF